ncbi:MAG: peptidase M16 [Fusobacteriia bacterium 4572_132]|nr:MAG: peptidase M16 [Fusobacteriia bacterium 4572_132]
MKIKKLSNGIPVIIEKITTSKSVSIGIFVKTGTKHELENEAGISHFLEHMLFKGTKTRTAKEISEEIDNVGGDLNAFTSKEVTAFYVKSLSEYTNVGIDILSDIYLNSVFSEEEMERERGVIIEEIRMYEDIPEEKIHDLNSAKVLEGGVLSKPVLGTEESVNKITNKKLKEYWRERYTSDNTIISVVGDIDEEKVLEELERKFSPLKRKMKERNYNEQFKVNYGIEEMKKDIKQVHLCLNVKGIKKTDEKRYILAILSNILGGNMSSRLFQEVREERGLAYTVYSYSTSYQEGGLFTVYAATTKESYKEVLEIIKKEFYKIKKEGITEAELNRAKNQLKSSLILGLESTKSRMIRFARIFMDYGKIETIEKTIEKIEKVSLKNVKDFANEIFNDEKYFITVLGDL